MKKSEEQNRRKVLLLLLVLLPFCSIGQTIAHSPGIYVLGTSYVALTPELYDTSYVDGGAIRVGWDTLNTADGVYNWAFIDHEIATARSRGKHISVAIFACLSAPQWVKDISQDFVYNDTGTGGVKHTHVLPVPYDNNYLKKWCKFLHAFGNRYKDSVTIAYVRGASESITNGFGMPTLDTFGHTWVGSYSYTTTKMYNAMKKVLDTFMTYLPNTPEWIEVGSNSIDADPVYLATTITSYGDATYANRYNVWIESVAPCMSRHPAPGSGMAIIASHPCKNGGQAFGPVVPNYRHGEDCHIVPSPMNYCGTFDNCDLVGITDTTFSKAVFLGMTYVEWYSGDFTVTAQQAPLKQGRDSLLAQATRCFPGLGHRSGTTAIQEVQNGFAWTMYPNPATKEVKITANAQGQEAVSIEFYNVLGKQLRSVLLTLNNSSTVTIPVSDFPPGIYIVALSRNGIMYETKRLTLVK